MHIHNVIDTDIHYKIDGITRAITNINETKRMLVQGDHNSERLTFEIPRYVDGHDFSKCNAVQIHYENKDISEKNKSEDVYNIKDLHIKSDDENIVVLSWLVHGNATKYAGTLNFGIRFSCITENNEIDYVWNTTVFKGISILPGLFSANQVIEQNHDVLAQMAKDIEDISDLAHEAVIETVLEDLTEKIRITSLPIVGAYTGWQIYADGSPLSESIIPIRESFVTVAGVMTGLTAGFFQNDKEIVQCKMNVTEHGSVKYVNFSDYERISEKNEIEYIQKKMVGVHFGRLNSGTTGAVTLTDIPDNSLILLASGNGLKLNAKGQSDTISATAKHLVIWTGSTRDHEVYGITGERMTYLVYTQDMSLTNLKPYNVYTAYTKSKADAVDGDTGISIVCPVHTYIGVIGAEFPK